MKVPRMKDVSAFPFVEAESEIDKTKSSWTAMVKANGPIKTRQQVRLNLTMYSRCRTLLHGYLGERRLKRRLHRRLSRNAKQDVLCLCL